MSQDFRLEAQIGALLLKQSTTLATAESCTGGLVAHRVTNIAGSSAYFMGGIVSYDNDVKTDVLKVPEELLQTVGAVSEEVARAMATNVRELLETDYALSVTGIAGPGGNTPTKPVGLTYIGLALPNGEVIVERYVWTGDREANKEASAEAALRLLLNHLQSASQMPDSV
jgi:PncC family amidohydrolase